MSNFKRITIQEFEQERFYKLYKFLFEDDYFRKLSDSSKIAYCMFRDRFELSKMNNWIDENGNVYLIFTTKDLCELLNCGTQKVTKIKKELESFNLLEQERMGLNKPNKIYILEPQKPYEDSSVKEFRKSKFQNSENQKTRISKIKKQEFRNSKSNDTDLNNTDYIETENNDRHDMNDTYNNQTNHNHSNHTNHQQSEFNNDALKFQVLEELPQQIKDYLSNFEIREIRIIKSVLLKGKKSFNNTFNTYYRLEDVEFELVSVLKRFKAMLLQKNETVEAMQGYLMQSIKAELEEIHTLNMRRQNMKKHNIFNQ
ncbi:replication initiator protein/RepA-like protein [Staphylococcus epidermidis]|jgi:replication protein|uniref:replication initiator protein A n=1 Tax=Bacillati TaxID=1783272 RepID=UPI0003BE633F|nr:MULTISPECIES: replication initiator protein A [Staphylococcus]RQN33663.1 replication protein [Paraburkholderia tropica]HCU9890951.1 replication initiator protein A [Staphylococcus aureus]KAB2277289.1 replication initiator protein A [Staphylococcus epidermidis]MBC2967127.1 replication initiator protein A [Staphylococcus epidermidis]MBC2973599.1 replication initiator protein A [Staphylococcus epidermidis]